ncbi:C39 family peptidase [Bacillus alkalicellulosilyticus]|uniref:C39 family peptidase n=1 Tax=Alkalihalobacterium alkalicellulosilyticum TaxID=1912214 RepID=UPI00099874E0|nr:C39 family peptidase [Bacillus alkalicellulosilyticus]
MNQLLKVENKGVLQLLRTMCVVVLVLITSSCQAMTNVQTEVPNHQDSNNAESGDTTEVIKLTAFQKDIEYLRGEGVKLPDLEPDSHIDIDTLASVLVEIYEALGGEFDISMLNPKMEASDSVKKLTVIDAYDPLFFYDYDEAADLEYTHTAYWLLRFHESLQKRLYGKGNMNATVEDLLRRMNLSTILYTWSQDATNRKEYEVQDLLEEEIALNEQLTRFLAAEMMVTAYEDIKGEIQTNDEVKPEDTDNINAWKANGFFFWTDNFEPAKTFTLEEIDVSVIRIFDSQLRINMDLHVENAPYGAVISALSYLMASYKDIEQSRIEEIIVLNERPYDWYVYQFETGEYSDVNCMPASVEMAMRYQGLPNIPTTENLRKENPLNGLGWHSVIAQDVMNQYGLQFSVSSGLNIDDMINELNQGNILFVMFREIDSDFGHAAIVKGYWKVGDNIRFILSDPALNQIGLFGYPEDIKDAETLVEDIDRHSTSYVIIPRDNKVHDNQ